MLPDRPVDSLHVQMLKIEARIQRLRSALGLALAEQERLRLEKLKGTGAVEVGDKDKARGAKA
jgi:hypothetical protein